MSIIKHILGAFAITCVLGIPIQPPPPPNGLSQILASYNPRTPWLPNFSTGITPIPCHSHNDYTHKLPLYEGLAAGCVSTEADIYLSEKGSELSVAHKAHELDKGRTLRTLYLDPLSAILEGQNSNSNENLGNGSVRGVFDEAPQTSLVLLVDFKDDFKDDPGKIWRLFNHQLDDLRQKGWLTYRNLEMGVVQRPITVVVTGHASVKDVIVNATYRDVFYDAPLADLGKTNNRYDSTNSYYASIPLDRAIGGVGEQFSDSQNKVIVEQIQKATSLGLKTTYWGLSGFPETLRNMVWENIVGLGASVLNVDDLVAVKEWLTSDRRNGK